MNLVEWGNDFISLLYPNLCTCCNSPLFKGEKEICIKCKSSLPYTKFHLDEENAVSQLFWGRVEISYATAYFVFRKGSRFQKILHKIKYQNGQSLGLELGKSFGFELLNTPFAEADLICPVPLHPKKLSQRGYNQSEILARGISESLKIPLELHVLKRVVQNPTQTKKSRFERWNNVDGIFETFNNHQIENKHVLLIDDVVTTGSTLEACATSILKIKNTKVSVAVLAMA
jgi:ComF family protein